MDQPISLMILKIILVMTHSYKKSCNASHIIYRGLKNNEDFEIKILIFKYMFNADIKI